MRHANLIPFAVGIASAIASVFAISQAIHFYESSLVTDGQVVRLSPSGHHPIVSFTAKDRKRIELPASAWWSVNVGDTVQVRYNVDDPRGTAVINNVMLIWWWPGLLSSLSAIFIFAGLKGESTGKADTQ